MWIPEIKMTGRTRPQERGTDPKNQTKGWWDTPSVTWTLLFLSGRKSSSGRPCTVCGSTVCGDGPLLPVSKRLCQRTESPKRDPWPFWRLSWRKDVKEAAAFLMAHGPFQRPRAEEAEKRGGRTPRPRESTKSWEKEWTHSNPVWKKPRLNCKVLKGCQDSAHQLGQHVAERREGYETEMQQLEDRSHDLADKKDSKWRLNSREKKRKIWKMSASNSYRKGRNAASSRPLKNLKIKKNPQKIARLSVSLCLFLFSSKTLKNMASSFCWIPSSRGDLQYEYQGLFHIISSLV